MAFLRRFVFCYHNDMPDFLKALNSGRVLLMDGAMGTELQRLGLPEEGCCELWNITHPEKVRSVHRTYADAGADILLTNTFQANPEALARHRQEGNLAAIIAAGVDIARSVVPERGWVLAAIGPLSDIAIKAIPSILNACSAADALLLETFSDPIQAAVFARLAIVKLKTEKPVLVSFTFDGQTLRTFKEASPETCARAAQEMGASALGVNCGRDLSMEACAAILRRYGGITSMPLFARPNAGTPTSSRAYPYTAEIMASQLPTLIAAGAVIVGGCCGTTPEHIRAFRVALGR